jgi:hypothetical protein
MQSIASQNNCQQLQKFNRVSLSRQLSGNFVQPQVWRGMLSLHLRPSIYDNTVLPLYCRQFHQCHSTMDSEADHATLSCHGVPCGWVSRHEHIKKIIAREGLRAARLKYTSDVPMLISSSDNDLVICLHTWRRHPFGFSAEQYRDGRHDSVFSRCCSGRHAA